MRTADARAALERRELRFPIGEVNEWAERYSYNVDDDGLSDSVGPAVRERGHFTRDEFLAVYEWKTTRTVHHVRKYTDAQVADVTGLAFRQTDEKLRICLLRALDGVDWPVASVLLHVGVSPEYPVIDFRALWSLGSGVPPEVRFDFWWAYVECCRGVAAEAGVSVRTLDQALWAYSEAKQPPGTR